MLLPNRENLEREIEDIKRSRPGVSKKILRVYDFLAGKEKIPNHVQFCYDILGELFTSGGYCVAEISPDPLIPFSFLQTLAGRIIFSAIYGSTENVLTVEEVVDLSKCDKKPQGYTKMWVLKNWDEGKGKLKGFRKGYQIFFYESDVMEFLRLKGIRE